MHLSKKKNQLHRGRQTWNYKIDMKFLLCNSDYQKTLEYLQKTI